MNPEPDTVPTDSYVADLSKLPNAVTSGDWTRRELFRRCMVEYPRCMHAATPEGRRLMLSRRPALTNTPWDAVVAASMDIRRCSTVATRPPGATSPSGSSTNR